MKPVQLLVATGNAGKLREIRELLQHVPVRLLSLADFPDIEAIDETGSTFAENAALKAKGYGAQARVFTLADDSGLAIDALGGAPGVYSARYLGEHATYPDRIDALLAGLKHVPSKERTARFVCALAIASAEGKIIYAIEATCEGFISERPRGSGGFGYDPAFIPEGFGQTFGELPAEVKNRISHRGRALAAAREFLHSLTATSTDG